ncbi:CysS/YqeB C-terminal domain-containing protein [Bradyrhizobium ontarionense]
MSLIGRRIQIALLNQASIPEEVSDFLQQLNIQVSLGPAGQLFLERKSEDVERDRKKIEHLIGERNAARARKDFAESDRIRDELASMGIVLKDRKGPDGKPVTTWEIAR